MLSNHSSLDQFILISQYNVDPGESKPPPPVVKTHALLIQETVNASLLKCFFLRPLREAVIRPSADKQVLANHRPMCLSEGIYWIDRSRTTLGLHELHIFDPFSSGFMPNFRTETVLWSSYGNGNRECIPVATVRSLTPRALPYCWSAWKEGSSRWNSK